VTSVNILPTPTNRPPATPARIPLGDTLCGYCTAVSVSSALQAAVATEYRLTPQATITRSAIVACSNKTESVSLRKCPSLAYQESAVTMTYILQSLSHIMAEKQTILLHILHRYGIKLHHCHLFITVKYDNYVSVHWQINLTAKTQKSHKSHLLKYPLTC